MLRLKLLVEALAELLDERRAVGCCERLQLDLAWRQTAAQLIQHRAGKRGENDAAVGRQVLRQLMQAGGMRRRIELINSVEQEHDAPLRCGLPEKIRERDVEFFGVVWDVGVDVSAARL